MQARGNGTYPGMIRQRQAMEDLPACSLDWLSPCRVGRAESQNVLSPGRRLLFARQFRCGGLNLGSNVQGCSDEVLRPVPNQAGSFR